MCVYYCRTYYKAVRGGGRRKVDDMCYDRRRAEACVDESAHHALGPVRNPKVCVYYCRTYYKAVRGGGRRRVEDMCYERRRAEAWTLDFGLWRSYSAVTVSPSGPRKLFKGVTTEQARCYSAGKHGEKICIGYQLLKLTGTNLVLTAGKLLLHQQAYSMTANFCTTVKP